MLIGTKSYGLMALQLAEWLAKRSGNELHDGGCHVPGLKDSPLPVGSVDLQQVKPWLK